MKNQNTEIEIDLGMQELNETLEEIQKVKSNLWSLIYKAEEQAVKCSVKITIK